MLNMMFICGTVRPKHNEEMRGLQTLVLYVDSSDSCDAQPFSDWFSYVLSIGKLLPARLWRRQWLPCTLREQQQQENTITGLLKRDHCSTESQRAHHVVIWVFVCVSVQDTCCFVVYGFLWVKPS